jgi:hypothetical protein
LTGLVRHRSRSFGAAWGLLCLIGFPASLRAQDITASPATIVLVPGERPVEVTLSGRGVSDLSSAVVMGPRGPVTGVRAILGRASASSRTVSLSADADAPPAAGYALRLMAGRQAIEVRTSIEVAAPPPAPSLVELVIEGPSIVDESSTGQYQARAVFSDRSTSIVPATWSVVAGSAAISGSGLLSAGAVSADTGVTIAATYSDGGSAQATADVTIRDAGFSPKTISTAAFRMTGTRFQPKTISTGAFKMTGTRFQPKTISTGAFKMTGTRE